MVLGLVLVDAAGSSRRLQSHNPTPPLLYLEGRFLGETSTRRNALVQRQLKRRGVAVEPAGGTRSADGLVVQEDLRGSN